MCGSARSSWLCLLCTGCTSQPGWLVTSCLLIASIFYLVFYFPSRPALQLCYSRSAAFVCVHVSVRQLNFYKRCSQPGSPTSFILLSLQGVCMSVRGHVCVCGTHTVFGSWIESHLQQSDHQCFSLSDTPVFQ